MERPRKVISAKRIRFSTTVCLSCVIIIMLLQACQEKENLRQFIMQMQTQGKTVVIVTHDVEFVAECNPRVVLMREGKIIADGVGNQILTNPALLEQASIVLPQIAQLFTKLAAEGLPKDIIDIYEAKALLMERLERRKP